MWTFAPAVGIAISAAIAVCVNAMVRAAAIGPIAMIDFDMVHSLVHSVEYLTRVLYSAGRGNVNRL